MGNVRLNGSSSGYVELIPPANAGSTAITLPSTSGTILSVTDWTPYTPVISGAGWAIGNGSIAGRYYQIGKFVDFYLAITFGSTSTYGSGALQITLPVTASGSSSPRFTGDIYDSSANDRRLATSWPASSTTLMPHYFGTNNSWVTITNTAPWTWATSDFMYYSGSYEAA